MAAHFLAPIVDDAAGWQVINIRTQCLIAEQLETAFDSTSRRRGLLGRSILQRGFAMVIAPCSAVHTFGMETAIDILFVDREGRVIKWREAVPPRRVSGAWGGFAVLELAPGGLAAAGGVAAGDVLHLQPVPNFRASSQ